MGPESCAHRDIRQIDNLKCCMSCGETLFLLTQHRTPPQLEHASPTTPFGVGNGLTHTYGDLQLSMGHKIRILILFPGQFRDPILCTIAIVDPREEQYDAVSYTWASEDGDDMKAGRVHLPDGVIPITENCEVALRQLRSRTSTRQLWVDAICIDQSNLRERNHQVGQMDQIYRLASTVHVCIHDPSRSYTECVRWLNSGANPVAWEKYDFTPSAITQTHEMFQRRYFSRVWVIQEIHLARIIVMHINSDEVTLRNSVINRLRHYDAIHVPQLLRDISSDQHTRTIIECLRISTAAHSSDPRDKVFGVLSLLDTQSRDFIPVDYALSYNQVLGLAVMLCIAECTDLRLLLFAHLPATSDHSTACTFGLEEFRRFLCDRKNGILGRSASFKDTWDDVQKHRRRFYNDIRTTRGLDNDPWLEDIHLAFDYDYRCVPWFAHVTARMKSIRTGSIESVKTLSAEKLSYIEHNPEWYATHQILPRIKVRAHLIDISLGQLSRECTSLSDIVRNQGIDEDSKYAWLHRVFQRPQDAEMSSNHQRSTAMTLANPETSSDFNGIDFMQCDSHIQDGSDTSRFFGHHPPDFSLFRTHYSVGSSRSWHTVGDHVFAIDGVSWPLLLRPVGSGTYRIVGLCYLWAAANLDYWCPGTFKGLWLEKPFDLGAQTRMIEIY
ncbi:heterokaryon incompatibility protein-domain-containing protein [Phaeosphaeria sp. MPI-PUGE-AT-0046c]|nr:heterokaryon incompatibility protein-domain-containing protein [Phaeosphaeria sp. MPI-PUGE-AT-0046c]